MQIVPNKKIWFIFSGALIALSIAALVFWGLKPSIDFTGGSLLEARFDQTPPNTEIIKIFRDFNLAEPSIQDAGQGMIVVRFQPVSEQLHQDIVMKMREQFGKVDETRFDSVGPTVGSELFRRAIIAVVLVTLMILFYIAWSFRHVSRPVPSWTYAGIVIFTFLHDVIIPLGLFAVLGHFRGWEVGSPFIAAVLTILGYSISDTIVVLDRVRENIRRHRGTFEEVVEASVHQTITRSINTSLTTMLALGAILFFGGESLRAFALALIVGIAVGAYSSIFIAAPLLVVWHRFKNKR